MATWNNSRGGKPLEGTSHTVNDRILPSVPPLWLSLYMDSWTSDPWSFLLKLLRWESIVVVSFVCGFQTFWNTPLYLDFFIFYFILFPFFFWFFISHFCFYTQPASTCIFTWKSNFSSSSQYLILLTVDEGDDLNNHSGAGGIQQMQGRCSVLSFIQ